ncbi:MAG TPA: hypothetical protein PK263_01775 [bacterium]|nr:hypothetical protein [bacterium]
MRWFGRERGGDRSKEVIRSEKEGKEVEQVAEELVDLAIFYFGKEKGENTDSWEPESSVLRFVTSDYLYARAKLIPGPETLSSVDTIVRVYFQRIDDLAGVKLKEKLVSRQEALEEARRDLLPWIKSAFKLKAIKTLKKILVEIQKEHRISLSESREEVLEMISTRTKQEVAELSQKEHQIKIAFYHLYATAYLFVRQNQEDIIKEHADRKQKIKPFLLQRVVFGKDSIEVLLPTLPVNDNRIYNLRLRIRICSPNMAGLVRAVYDKELKPEERKDGEAVGALKRMNNDRLIGGIAAVSPPMIAEVALGRRWAEKNMGGIGAEGESVPAPGGTGTELIGSMAPDGTGMELEASEKIGTPDRESEQEAETQVDGFISVEGAPQEDEAALRDRQLRQIRSDMEKQ